MKLKLLIPALLLAFNSFAQVEAYPVQDLTLCGFINFDLTVNTPLALGSQNPQNYSVAYFLTEADAQTGANPIANAAQYQLTPTSASTTQIIYVRVSHNGTTEFDITSFQIWYISVGVVALPDQLICGDVFTVPVLDLGNVYTGPGGTGTMLPPGTIISTNTTLYTFNQIGPCTQEASFELSFGDAVVAQVPTPLGVCDGNNDGVYNISLWDKYDEIIGGVDDVYVDFYTSYNQAVNQGNYLPASSWNYDGNLPHIVYARAENFMTGCYDIVELVIVEAPCQGNIVSGTVTYDMDGNGCTASDVLAAGVEVTLTSPTQMITTFTAPNGNYFFQNVTDGASTITVATGNGYVAAPATASVTFPGNTAGVDFCLSVPNPVNDVAVTLIPMTNAQSGFPSSYNLILENNGSLPASGTVTLQFDDTKINYNSSMPAMAVSGNTLTFSYSNLQPFQNSNIFVFFTVNIPQITPPGQLLVFTATINPITGDANPADNVHVTEQIIVNAMDPNDITVHEGEFITPQETDKYLHYTIRFQNEGSANAVNIRVEATTDEKLDWSTFEPVASSHNYSTVLGEDGVEFLFNNINLTWSDNDEPASHGYITYRVKPVTTVQLGDFMQGSAGIFFDFNDPVMTNTATTTIQNAMGTRSFAKNGFVMYPNPASDNVTLHMANTSGKASVVITDVLGKIVLSANQSAESVIQINTSALNSGMYFVTVTSGEATSTQKLVIK